MIPDVVVFDLDETLAASKEAITASMADHAKRLLDKTKMAVTSGGKLEQLIKQVSGRLPETAKQANLYLLPTSGAALYEYALGEWSPVYIEHLSEDEALRIKDLLREGAESTGYVDFNSPSHGERIEFRTSQVTLSTLGQQAPIAEKVAWDPDGAKRNAIREAVAKLLPAYDVKRGGATSIDVTKHGVNKAYGIRKLSAYLHIPIESMLYVGDALFPGGNDEVVKETGIKTREVKDPSDTEKVIDELLVG